MKMSRELRTFLARAHEKIWLAALAGEDKADEMYPDWFPRFHIKEDRDLALRIFAESSGFRIAETKAPASTPEAG